MNVFKIQIPHFLADTWWYGMSNRISNQKFEEMARLRAKQGFSAVQIVIGIPPEIGPENINAPKLNQEYLNHSLGRVKLLNSLGLTAIIYGAWGQQIEWLGEKEIIKWWKSIIKTFNNLDVIYCITGESDIWISEENKLLPNKSTDDLLTSHAIPFFHPRIIYVGKKLINIFNNQFNKYKKMQRHKKWSTVLQAVSDITNKPIMIHVLSNMTSQEAVNNPELLDLVTVQTGHSLETKQLLWKLPLKNQKNNPKSRFINLEPWYEGITGRFKTDDQLYAYWTSMMAGAYAYCYGAHGIWNVGDGKFLSHWGKQTLNQALKLDTPKLIGLSHSLFSKYNFFNYKRVEVEEKNSELIKITRSDENSNFVTYIPEITKINNIPAGKIFSPTKGKFIKKTPESGQIVIINSKI